MKQALPNGPEYGPAIGIAVPQANTTVEPEFHLLLGASHTLLTARMTSPSADSSQRLIDYFNQLGQTLSQFDVAPLRVAGFACTGSSYLVGHRAETERLESLSAAAGFPVVSAAQSILAALRELGASRIAVLSPYPGELAEAGLRYWRSAGLTVTAWAGLPTDLLDTRQIYALRTAAVLQVLDTLDSSAADAVLLSGTGMPTLRAIASRRANAPVLSSNLCLAWQMQCAAGDALPPSGLLANMLSPQAPWRQAVGEAAL
jgi:maleate isomerase